MNILRKLILLPLCFVAISSSAQTVSWTTPATIDASANNKGSAQMVISADGTLATEVWKETVGKFSSVVKARSATISGGVASWGNVSEISARGGEIQYLTVKLSADGTRAVAAWSYRANSAKAAQSAVATISGNTATWGGAATIPAGDRASELALALSSDGTQALVIVHGTTTSPPSPLISVAGAVNGSSVLWGRTRFVTLGSAFGNLLKVELSQNGTLATALWMKSDGSNFVLQSVSGTVSGARHLWGAKTDLSAPGFNPQQPNLALSADGTKATVVWVRQVSRSVSIVRTRSAVVAGTTATWGATTVLSSTSLSSTSPDVALSSDGSAATAVWIQGGVLQSASGAISGSDATWGGATVLSSTSDKAYAPSVHLSADGKSALALWSRSKGLVTQFVTTSAVGLIDGTTQGWGAAVDVSDLAADTFLASGGLSSDGLIAAVGYMQGGAGAYKTLNGSFGSVVYPTPTPTPIATNTPTPTPTPAATATPIGQTLKQVPIPVSTSNDHHVVLRVRDFPNGFRRDYYGYLIRVSDQKLEKIGKFKVRKGQGRLEFHNITPGEYITFTVVFRSKEPKVVSSRRRTITVK